VPSTNALQHDARLETYERHVDGDIALALGETAHAAELLSSVHSSWKRLNYRWRAEEAEAALRRISTNRPVFERPARDHRHPMPIGSQLSARNHQILRMVVAGHCNRTIAQELNIAPRTAKNIIDGMYGQFSVHKRAELIAAAIREDPTLIVPAEHTPAV
jgi:DNA-binding NarL/FixJ family response regulator